MDGQQYLNQISQTGLPKRAKVGKRGILHNRFFIVGMIGVVGLTLILLFGMIIGGGRDSERSLVQSLKLHLSGTISAVDGYQDYVRSSNLRSSSASLKSVLADASGSLETYIADKYGLKKDKNYDGRLQTKAEANTQALTDELFKAKINGILDRIYAHKMAYEISIFTSEEQRIYNMTKDETLKGILQHCYDSLENLYDSFNDFSETKN